MAMAVRAAKLEGDDPVTLHRIMQNMIGEGLKERYEPPQKLSHELFVLMLQIKERERREKLAKPAPQAWSSRQNTLHNEKIAERPQARRRSADL
jgi:hypothetical protein